MPAAYADGTFPTGAPIITINSVTYVCNKISFDKSSETTNIQDQAGAHSGALFYEGPVTGSAEVQFAASATAEPTTAAVSSATGIFLANISGANTNCIITSVAIDKPNRGPWTATLGFQVKKN